MVAFLQEFGARKPPKGWNIPNHEWSDSDDDWDFQSEQHRWFSYSVSGDMGSAAPDGRTSEVDEFFEGRV